MMQEPATSSGSLGVATTVVIANPALLCGLVLNPGSAASSVTVYDNASAASGTVVYSMVGAANTSSIPAPLSIPIYCKNGITIVVAGTAATAVAHYQRENG